MPEAAERASASERVVTPTQRADLAPPAPAPKAPAHNGQAKQVNGNGHVHAPSSSSTAAAPPPWSPPPPPKCIQLETDEDRIAWRKAMRFRALWEEAIVRSGTVSFQLLHPGRSSRPLTPISRPIQRSGGFFPVAVAIHAWQLAQEGAQPKNNRRHALPHSPQPRSTPVPRLHAQRQDRS